MPTTERQDLLTETHASKDDEVPENSTHEVETKEETGGPSSSSPEPQQQQQQQEEVVSQADSREIPRDASSPAELSISKVWETIHRDLNSGGGSDEEEEDLDCSDCKEEGEVDTLEELLVEPPEGSGPLSCSSMVQQEEEPSDWEDREENMEEEEEEEEEGEAADAGSSTKKVVSECVLISSDDEGMPQRHKSNTAADVAFQSPDQAIPPGELADQIPDEEEDERLQLDTSSEISEPQSQKRAQDFEVVNGSDTTTDLSAVKLDTDGSSTEVMDGGNGTEGTDEEVAAETEETVAEADENTGKEAMEEEEEKSIGELEEPLEKEDQKLGNADKETEQRADDDDEEEVRKEAQDEEEVSVPMDVSQENATGETEPAENQLESVDCDLQKTVANGCELGDSVIEDSANNDQTKPADAQIEDQPADRNLVEEVENSIQTDAESMQVDCQPDPRDENNEGADAVCTDALSDVDNTASSQLESVEMEDESDRADESADVQRSELAGKPSDSSKEDVIDLELTCTDGVSPESSKAEDEEESAEIEDSPPDAKASPGQAKPVEDDDLEVLEVKDSEDGTNEPSGSESHAEEKLKSDSTSASETDAAAASTNNVLKGDSDKEVEMIDLEVGDGAEASACKTDQNQLSNKPVVERQEETTRSSSCTAKDQDKVPCESVSVQKKETPEIVVLDLENDSESDQKDQDASDRTVQAAGKDTMEENKDSKNSLADPVEVDLSSESAADVNTSQDDEEADLQKVLKEDEEAENETGVLTRKRHLSQSQHHLNCAEQPKKPKLDLSEEPMEEALKQLDVLRMKEKRSSSAPTKVKLTKEVLEELINRRLHEHINNSQKSIIVELRSRCEGLEKAVDRWKKKAQALQTSIMELSTELQKHQKKPRGPTRTVGINVRISTSEPLRPLNSKLPQILPKAPDPVVAKAANMTVTSVSQSGPVPTHLVPNLASSPNKTFAPPAATAVITTVAAPVHKPAMPQNASLAGGATVKIIDLTHEDDESVLKNVRQAQAVPLPVPVQQASVVAPSFSGAGVVLSNALTRTSAPITLQTTAGAPLMGMPVSMPVTMQIIPSVSSTGGGVTLRGPRPGAMNIQSSMAPHNSRVTTYLVPSGLPAMGSPRQIVPISAGGGPQVVQAAGPRPAPPMQTFLLRMNTVPTPVSNTYTTMTSSNMASTFSRAPPNVTVSPRNVVNLVASANPPSLFSAVPKNVTSTLRPANPANTVVIPLVQKHPAPFPQQPTYNPNPQFKALPPKPALKISKVANGIVLSWNLTLNSTHSEISKYQLYAYQEGSGPPLPTLWKKVGDVKALPLPMACTLTQFMEGNKYHFAICAVDKHNRCGPFSDPSSILLTAK